MITGNLVTNLVKYVNVLEELGSATTFHVKEPVLFLRTRISRHSMAKNTRCIRNLVLIPCYAIATETNLSSTCESKIKNVLVTPSSSIVKTKTSILLWKAGK